MHYLLFYEFGEDYIARRAEFRGALADPVDGAILLFKGDSPSVAESFARVDPYVTSGIVKRWHVRQWNTVAGESCANPVLPSACAF